MTAWREVAAQARSCLPRYGRLRSGPVFRGGLVRHLVLVAALGGSLLLTAPSCVGGKTQVSDEDKERLKPYILEAVPPDAKKTDVNFENKVHLVGYKIEPELAGPKTPVKVTYYWRCDETVEEGWRLFTHVQHEG